MNRNQPKDHASEGSKGADKKTGDKSKKRGDKANKHDGNSETVMGEINGEAKNETE